MRAMGPGSVSSLLKTALDVVYYALWVAVGLFLAGAVIALFIDIPDLNASVVEDGVVRTIDLTRPLLASSLAAFAVYSAGFLIVVARLREIFVTLASGDPFHPENVTRLRIVGLALAGLAVADAVGRTLVASIVAGTPSIKFSGDLTPWFSVLVVFVLAEVFREGARLRHEAELTI
jgi:hypothetical protein